MKFLLNIFGFSGHPTTHAVPLTLDIMERNNIYGSKFHYTVLIIPWNGVSILYICYCGQARSTQTQAELLSNISESFSGLQENSKFVFRNCRGSWAATQMHSYIKINCTLLKYKHTRISGPYGPLYSSYCREHSRIALSTEGSLLQPFGDVVSFPQNLCRYFFI